MTSFSKHLSNLLHRGCLSRFGGRVGSKENQSRTLVKFGKEFKGNRVVGFEAGGQLVDQAGLALDSGCPGRGSTL